MGPPSTPAPSQASQRPCLVLNENHRGSSSGTPVPHDGQVRLVEKSASPFPDRTFTEPFPNDSARSNVARSTAASFPS